MSSNLHASFSNLKPAGRLLNTTSWPQSVPSPTKSDSLEHLLKTLPVILFYDFILTLDVEIEEIWGAPLRPAVVLFLLVRYSIRGDIFSLTHKGRIVTFRSSPIHGSSLVCDFTSCFLTFFHMTCPSVSPDLVVRICECRPPCCSALKMTSGDF